jgi:hypothetical protein
LFPWLKKTRKLQPSLALDFQGLLRSALIAKISRAETIYGMSDAREGSRWFYDRVAKVDRRAHAIERYIKLAQCAGATVGASLRCPIPSGDPLPRFDEYPPFILLHPFARGSGKSLSNVVIEELCRAFAPTRVVAVGQSRRKIDAPPNCVDLINRTSLLQLIWLIRVAHFVISVDSGPMHVAAALTDRVVSIHTWTDPRRVGPYNPNAWVWKTGQLCRVNRLGIAKIRRGGRRFRCNDVGVLVDPDSATCPSRFDACLGRSCNSRRCSAASRNSSARETPASATFDAHASNAHETTGCRIRHHDLQARRQTTWEADGHRQRGQARQADWRDELQQGGAVFRRAFSSG